MMGSRQGTTPSSAWRGITAAPTVVVGCEGFLLLSENPARRFSMTITRTTMAFLIQSISVEEYFD